MRQASGAASGPDSPKAQDASQTGLPPWRAGEHDHLQYHFFSKNLFVQARVFLTPSLEEHSLWIFDHRENKLVDLINSSSRMNQASGEFLELEGPQLRIVDGPGGGTLHSPEVKVEFRNRSVYSWLPAGQGEDAVIHRPDLEISITYKGEEHIGRGYSKRYFGRYGPHWGYRFIQSSWLGGRKFLWTADATFRLGEGEAKYNYFKLLDSSTGELVQAQSSDTYQQDAQGFADINGVRYVATVTPLAEWLHDYDKGRTNSRMQLRYCRIQLSQGPGNEVLEGYALNERCFGTLG